MRIVSEDNISGIVQRTLNHVDPRLVDHGRRVAYMVSRMLDVQGTHSRQERCDLCFLAMLHDIGAYKTDEIDKIVQFETQNVWNHSIYGYLFLRELSPLGALAPAILFHHLDYKDFEAFDVTCGEAAQLIHLADRVDMFEGQVEGGREALYRWLEKSTGTVFDPAIVALFYEADTRWGLTKSSPADLDFHDILGHVHFTEEQVDTYLKMLVFAIDFRSRHTVTHTVTTTRISAYTAQLMGLDRASCVRIYYGALLHDLGKIGIPVEILEFPGKLSAQAMTVMRTHVNVTEEILGGQVEPTTANIALRHHEKLDGTGYPRGLTEATLSLEERIVAVADIVSALGGTRSYKDAFPKERTLAIIAELCAKGQLDAAVVDTITQHFDEIEAQAQRYCGPIIDTYREIQAEYEALVKRYV